MEGDAVGASALVALCLMVPIASLSLCFSGLEMNRAE